MPTAVIQSSVAISGLALAGSKSVTYDSALVLNENFGVVGASFTNAHYKFAFPYTTAIKFMFMLSTKDVTVGFSVDGLTPWNTLGEVVLKANVPRYVTYATRGASPEGSTLATAGVPIAGGVHVKDCAIAGNLQIVVGYDTDAL